jgi:predicted deacetylase
MTGHRDRLLLASIHDVSPRFEAEVDGLLDLLQPFVGQRLAMLVVPNHWGDAPLIPGSAFAAKLRGWADQGVEMFLHGFTHRAAAAPMTSGDRMRARWMTAGEGEFLSLSCEEAAGKIAEGRSIVEDIIGRPITGFIAPAWLYGDGAMEALEQTGIRIAEDHFRVWSPADQARLATGPVITWASRSGPRLASSLIAAPVLRRAPLGVMRVGVHPPDVRSSALVRSIKSTFRSVVANRRPSSYADLLPENDRA